MNKQIKIKGLIALAVLLLTVATVGASRHEWESLFTLIGHNGFATPLAHANSSTTVISSDLSVLGNVIVNGSTSTTKLRLLEQAYNDYRITSNVDANGVKDTGPGGAGSAAYTNWIDLGPLVLKLMNSEDGSYINNMIQINPVRTEFGPPGGSGGDQDKRIGPSNEKRSDGVNPATGVNQVYQLLLPTTNGINGSWSNAVPVCLNPSVPNSIEQCGPNYNKIVGTTQEAPPAGGNTFFDTMGIARNVICLGKSSPGDLLVLGTTSTSIYAPYYLKVDNSAPSADVVGMALSNCFDGGGHVDVLLGPRSYVTSSIAAAATPSNHIITSGATPTVSACGVNPAIVGTDAAGKVTIGTSIGSDQTCTITFNKAYPHAPACFGNNESNSSSGHNVTTITTPTTLTLKVTNSFSDGNVVSYGCIGY